jgi:hypothetical protein
MWWLFTEDLANNWATLAGDRRPWCVRGFLLPAYASSVNADIGNGAGWRKSKFGWRCMCGGSKQWHGLMSG